jgi:cell division septation protein DedD
VPLNALPLTALPLTARSSAAPDDRDRVVDLGVRRAAAAAAVRAVADAPVRHLPAALLDALQGSWGTPQELLDRRTPPVRLAVAR